MLVSVHAGLSHVAFGLKFSCLENVHVFEM